jgi:hypothetical protein
MYRTGPRREPHPSGRPVRGVVSTAAFDTDEEAEAFVDSQNLHRRHLNAEWRQERVRGLRGKGMSTREIAKEVGCDNATVHRDLKRGVASATPEPQLAPAEAKPQPEPPPEPMTRASGRWLIRNATSLSTLRATKPQLRRRTRTPTKSYDGAD